MPSLHCLLRGFGFSIGLAVMSGAQAQDLNLIGLFPGKAVVSIDGGPPRTLSVGSNHGPIRLLSTTRDSAVFEISGRRQTLALGQYYAGTSGAGQRTATLNADVRGHFIVQGSINGASQSFLVDTGATLLVLGAEDARRMGIDFRQGQLFMSQTANGPVPFYRVVLDKVKIGDIELSRVEAGVQESGMPPGIALLGMSFLNRTQMQREGSTMVLTQRF